MKILEFTSLALFFSLTALASQPALESGAKLSDEEIKTLKRRHSRPAPSSSEERIEDGSKILEIGEITAGPYIAGGIVGSVVGFGSGHAIQGRYLHDGWIFTLLEGSLLGIGAAAGDFSPGYLGSGRIGVQGVTLFMLMGVRVWQIVDLWAKPPGHNRRYRELKAQMDDPKTSLFIMPGAAGSSAGVTAYLAF